MGWIGVDFDGTLAVDCSHDLIPCLGEPVSQMLQRVKAWLHEGKDVRIVTGRTVFWWPKIQAWCRIHFGKELPVTNCKDGEMIELWDDRVVTVERNTGRRLSP